MNIQIMETVLNGEKINSVNAREIHSHLGVKTHLSTWIQRAIEKYDFIENIDFSILKSGNPNGGLSKIDYIVTLDMAKELCMLENNPKGKEYRKYFIDIEKSKNKPLTYEEIMQNALLIADKKVKELEHKIEIDKPKVVFADAVSSTNTDLLIRDWAKSIGVQEKACRKWLIDKKLMFDSNKNKENGKNAKYRASAYGISSGYIKQTETPIIHPNPSFPSRIGITVRITSKGQLQLTDKILKDLCLECNKNNNLSKS